MTAAGLAAFVFVGFLAPVPSMHWLDAPAGPGRPGVPWMYAGHFAAGLALEAREPVTVTPGVFPGFSLDSIDWSHSLATSLLWSGVFASLFLRRGRRVAAVMGIATFGRRPVAVLLVVLVLHVASFPWLSAL